MYKLETLQRIGVEEKYLTRLVDNASIPFDPANTDYANFKKEILADEAQLQDADGNVMADAKAYVASLP